jgi:hypothetical protein
MDIRLFFIWSRFKSLSEIIRSKNPYVQFQMLKCTISPRILNQLGHGHKFFLSGQGSIHYQKLSVKNPYVQYQMLQCTISPMILNQLGHGHKFFFIWSRFNSLTEIIRSKNSYCRGVLLSSH